jgi:ABC-type multidrug transport system fused ATPase/permease subunit
LEGEGDGSFVLRVPALVIPKGKLCIVCGSVGSGKTSLVSALLGEMHQEGGELPIINGSVALVGQSAWIQNATVKEAILFGRKYDAERYCAVVKAAQLRSDIRMLPRGEETEIGERGINLSGGQKQRVSIARALYASPDKDVYLLDDPLSAVDADVAHSLWTEVRLSLPLSWSLWLCRNIYGL